MEFLPRKHRFGAAAVTNPPGNAKHRFGRTGFPKIPRQSA